MNRSFVFRCQLVFKELPRFSIVCLKVLSLWRISQLRFSYITLLFSRGEGEPKKEIEENEHTVDKEYKTLFVNSIKLDMSVDNMLLEQRKFISFT